MTVVETRLQENVLICTINSGKGNPLSPEVLQNLDEALTRSEQDDEIGALLILGQPGLLSGGFDLSIMLGGTAREITELVHQGGSLFARMYASQTPIVVGATGHAVAGGALMLLASDSRIGHTGTMKIGLNEVAIGMVLPSWALTLACERLSPRHIQQSTATARIYDSVGAQDAGFLDLLVEQDQVESAALEEAQRLAALNAKSYAATIKLTRGATNDQLKDDLSADRDFIDSLDA